jgi:CRP-like cAMP-binding protein
MRGHLIATVNAGSIVGEVGWRGELPRSTTAIARTDCALAPLDTRELCN